MLVQVVKEYVSNACSSPQNVFGPAFFDQHIMVVREYSQQLAAQLNADPEILDLAAYLHDIAAIQDFSSTSRHHIIGAEIAEELLAHHQYPAESINKITQCIRSHSSPVQPGNGSIEEICLSHADAMSQITRPAYWLYCAYHIRQYDFEKGRDWLRKRVENHWNALLPQAKVLIETTYPVVQSVLRP